MTGVDHPVTEPRRRPASCCSRIVDHLAAVVREEAMVLVVHVDTVKDEEALVQVAGIFEEVGGPPAEFLLDHARLRHVLHRWRGHRDAVGVRQGLGIPEQDGGTGVREWGSTTMFTGDRRPTF